MTSLGKNMADGGQLSILTWIIFFIIRWISDTVSLSNLFLNLTTSICIMFRADCETGGLIWWLVYPIIVAGLVPAHISLDFRDQYPSSPEISEPVPHWSRNFEISRYWSRNFEISTLLIPKFRDHYPYWSRNFEISRVLIPKFRDQYLLNEKIFEITDFLWESDPSSIQMAYATITLCG